MFNLLVGLEDVVPVGRLFEYTDDRVKRDLGDDYEQQLMKLPTLMMPEVEDPDREQVATIGHITSIRATGRSHRFEFEPNGRLQPIPSGTVIELAHRLNIDPDSWEFRRTHWAVKQADLFEVLFEHVVATPGPAGAARWSGSAVEFPAYVARDPHLVAVMMPFDPSFDVVYETIKLAVEDARMTCVRVDDIWEHDHVMGDVASLLWRARVVLADLTGRNPNVFYETGLAHALPRRTILLTQGADDVPFDLRSLRYLKYGLGSHARRTLREQLADRLRTLANQPVL